MARAAVVEDDGPWEFIGRKQRLFLDTARAYVITPPLFVGLQFLYFDSVASFKVRDLHVRWIILKMALDLYRVCFISHQCKGIDVSQ